MRTDVLFRKSSIIYNIYNTIIQNFFVNDSFRNTIITKNIKYIKENKKMIFPDEVWGIILQFNYEMNHRTRLKRVVEKLIEYHRHKRPRIFEHESEVTHTGMTLCHGKIQVGRCMFFTGLLLMDIHNPCIFAIKSTSNYWTLHDISDNPCKKVFVYENDEWVQVHDTNNGNWDEGRGFFF